jgi:tetratricopeptide (TPR) repeat protein
LKLTRHFLLVSFVLVSVVAPSILSAQDVRGSSLSGFSANGTGVGNSSIGVGINSMTESGTLDVVLKAPNGAPIKGAIITILQPSGQSYKQLTANTDVVHFNELAAPTEFNVRVIVPGFQPAMLKVETKARYSAKLVFELQPMSAQDVAFAARLATLPPKAQKELGKAMDALRADDTSRARHPLDALEHMAPNHPEVTYVLGIYASKTHDEEHAKSYWTHTLELDPKHLQALCSLTEIDIREKNYDEALQLAQRAVQVDSSSWRAHAVLANAYSRKNSYPEALQQAERALELGHSQADVVEPMLASLLARSGNKARAVEILQSFVVAHPANADAREQLDRLEKGESASPSADNADDAAVSDAATALLPVSNWLPPDVDEKMPPVASGGACNVAEVLQGVGQRIEELVHNVDRYTATESLFHESINKWGAPSSTESRKFEYVASISELQPGFFAMDEYRRTDGLPAQFPSGVATLGLPGLALIFHPHNAGNYDMVCEGLATWDGVPVWQIHFRQRPDKPSTIRSYRESLQAASHPVPLKGRAWIAADSFQLIRLETDLVAPVPEIKLVADHIIIDYGPVHFRETATDLWLPHAAEVYFHWNNVRMHRRHTFSDYLLFTTDDHQRISVPAPVPPPSDVPRPL